MEISDPSLIPITRYSKRTNKIINTWVATGTGQLGWLLISMESSDRRKTELFGRVFSVNARFDGPAVYFYVILSDRKWVTISNSQHFSNKIDSSDAFGDRMFDLNWGILCYHCKITSSIPEDEYSSPRNKSFSESRPRIRRFQLSCIRQLEPNHTPCNSY